jgi:hypothetical protein
MAIRRISMTGSADIDALMLEDPLYLTVEGLNAVYERIAGADPKDHTPRNIDQIIEWHRRQRKAYQSGEKVAKASGPVVDISSVRAALVKPTTIGKSDRRF